MPNNPYSQATWYPEPLDEDDPLRGNPDSEEILDILRSLHRGSADAFEDRFLTAEDQRYWKGE
jgi:hypothetical protein